MQKDDTNQVSAGQAGSTNDLIQPGPNPNDGGNGESGKGTEPSTQGGDKGQGINAENFVDKKQYEAAEKKLGEQGRELGEFRNFFNEVSPLLDKLQTQPELVEAILAGKVDASLAQAVFDNKVKIEDATKITEAHEEVKKDLGAKRYQQSSPDDIERMITEKVNEVSKKIEDTQKNLKKDIQTSEERRKFEGYVADFISKTDDFADYAESINQWLANHPDVYDIETAYEAVKGKALIAQQLKANDVAKAEEAKRMALNTGGGSQGGRFTPGANVVDQLIGNSSNPNAL